MVTAIKRIGKRIAPLLLAALMLLLPGCAADPYDALRLHVIANSDSVNDQLIKLEVRDAVLSLLDERELTGREETRAYISAHTDELTQAANDVLKECGVAYTARCELGYFDFPEKNYDGVIYPAGKYQALRIVLGSGEGGNWWCVLFPPLCVATEAEYKKIKASGIKYDSRILKLIEKMFTR